MKKLLSAFLIISMLLTFFACNVEIKESNDDDEDDTEESSVQDTSSDGSTQSSDSSDVSDVSNTTEDPDADIPSDKTDGTFSLGSISGNDYTNEFLGLGCDVPASWTTLSTTEMMEMNGVTANTDYAEYEQEMANAFTFYDLYTEGTDGSSINIVFEKSGNQVSVDEYYSESTLSQLEEVYESMGGTVTFEEVDVTIDYSDFPGVLMDVNIAGAYLCQLSIAMDCGTDYITVITITSMSEEQVTEILGYLYLL